VPNHVTTRCAVSGPTQDIDAFRSIMFVNEIDENGLSDTRLDFSQIVPAPKCFEDVSWQDVASDALNVMSGGEGANEAWKRLLRSDHTGLLAQVEDLIEFETFELRDMLERAIPGCIATARELALCIAETGSACQIDWSIENWGTKWNAYSFTLIGEHPLEFRFDTAWSFPEPVFKELARTFPRLKFNCTVFDDGWLFAGSGVFDTEKTEGAFAFREPTAELYEIVYGIPCEEEL
jgi:hypothetical protein